MATESTARPKDTVAADKKTSGTRPRAPLPEARLPAPPPLPRTELAPVADAAVDFEAHDTIPAPPWLDDEAS
jgi:hypothetical protein